MKQLSLNSLVFLANKAIKLWNRCHLFITPRESTWICVCLWAVCLADLCSHGQVVRLTNCDSHTLSSNLTQCFFLVYFLLAYCNLILSLNDTAVTQFRFLLHGEQAPQTTPFWLCDKLRLCCLQPPQAYGYGMSRIFVLFQSFEGYS